MFDSGIVSGWHGLVPLQAFVVQGNDWSLASRPAGQRGPSAGPAEPSPRRRRTMPLSVPGVRAHSRSCRVLKVVDAVLYRVALFVIVALLPFYPFWWSRTRFVRVPAEDYNFALVV